MTFLVSVSQLLIHLSGSAWLPSTSPPADGLGEEDGERKRTRLGLPRLVEVIDWVDGINSSGAKIDAAASRVVA